MFKTKLIRALSDYVTEYIRDDLNAKYGLNKEVSATFLGDGIGIGTCTVGVLTIESDVGGDSVKLTSKPFPPDAELWNGPNVIPDTWGDGSMEMSLWHDLIWAYAKHIGKALNMTEQEVMKWGNGILVAAWEGYAKKYGKSHNTMLSKVGYWLCEISRRFWRLFFVLVVIAIVGSGCAQPPDWHMQESGVIEYTKGE